MVHAKSHEMMDAARALAVELSSLLAMQVSDEESLRHWYAKAQEVANHIKADPILRDHLPIRIWNYLSDADIRLENQTFATSQEALVRKYIHGLENGLLLTGEQIDGMP